MGRIIARIKKQGVLISDGAWGTFIHAKGLKPDESPESWNLSHPDDIYDVARSYVEAGADLILTNSFGGSPFKLAPYGLADKTYAINKAAAEISKRAAGDKVLVMGSVGPTGKILMMGDVTEEELVAGFREQIRGLSDGGADAILVETMSDPDEARAAIKAAKGVTDKEVICTFTFTLTPAREYRTMMGTSPEETVDLLVAEGVDIIGANCGNGTAGMIEIVKQIRRVNAEIPVLVHANAGMPILKDGISVFPETATEMAAQIEELIQAGANIVGGCCGTTPEHIGAIADVVHR
jgi:5-methyltetrahydrofolate--homocysteine methyltransferase